MESAEAFLTPDPLWAEFQKTGDATHLGQCWAGIWRGAVCPTLDSALSPGPGPGRNARRTFLKAFRTGGG